MVKICAIGDPHGDLKKIKKAPKDVDFYLLTGDLGKADLARKAFFEKVAREKEGLPEKERTIKEKKAIHDEVHYSAIGVLNHLKGAAPVYTIEGNVGLTSEAEALIGTLLNGFVHFPTKKIIDEDLKINLVKNRIRILEGLRIGFLEMFTDECWVREFRPGDYKKKMKSAKRETCKAKRILERFGKVDVLVCHQPPYGFLDKVDFPGVPQGWKGKHAGSKVILEYIKKHQPSYVFCGHIHEGEGKVKIGESEVFNLGVASHKVVEF